jgi:arylsulfatase A-like enzyme
VIIFVSDHGYHLGHHGLWQKGDLFEGSVHIPLLIAAPELRGNRSSDAVVEMVDIYPTVAELCRLPLPKHLKGQSLVPILNETSEIPDDTALTVAWSRAQWLHPELKGKRIKGYSLRSGRYRYTEWGGGEYGVELYDYKSDPEEYINLARQPGHEAVIVQMKRLLSERIMYAQ